MAIQSIKSDLSFLITNVDILSEKTSDEDLIQIIVKPIKSEKRRARAARQLRIYSKKITYHPEMRSLYINLIKELIKYERRKV